MLAESNTFRGIANTFRGALVLVVVYNVYNVQDVFNVF